MTLLGTTGEEEDGERRIKSGGLWISKTASIEMEKPAWAPLIFLDRWTKMEAIDSLMRKAGYNGVITEALRKRLRITRYQSSLYTMHYSDYATHVKTAREGAPRPIINGVKPALR
ncbi:hypothetical protein KSP40_PGU014881 [Platanthera guangdongensis]|uniref:AMMECR1 domain-containing protein n=1 Tax=Platanthera guangdongensis TaxID=2320717 RepID=A0ABR2MKJ8_9ASPA